MTNAAPVPVPNVLHEAICAAVRSRLEAIDLRVDHLKVLRVTVAINPKNGLIDRVFLNPEYEFERKRTV